MNSFNSTREVRVASEMSSDYTKEDSFEKLVASQAAPREYEVLWIQVFVYIYQHIAAVYGLYLLFTKAFWCTTAFNCITYYFSIIGVTAGAHRLWSHRSYKAKKPLQIFLMLCHSMANQYTIFLWVRDHRVHHKYSDTDADPYNATRGFFYSHIGWVVVKRHPEMIKRKMVVNISDMYANPVIMFQKRNLMWLLPFCTHVIPTIIPILIWHESLLVAFHVNMLRYILSLHAIFTINSLAHKYGTRPYDKGISPTQNTVTTLVTFGDGFHNYHHSFPQDYRAGELGSLFNFSASFIDFCAWLGLVYDRKFMSEDLIKRKMLKTGDSSKLCNGFNTRMKG